MAERDSSQSRWGVVVGMGLLACSLWLLSADHGANDPLAGVSDAMMRVLGMTPRTVFVVAWVLWTVRIAAWRGSVAEWERTAWKIVSIGAGTVAILVLVVLVAFLGPH